MTKPSRHRLLYNLRTLLVFVLAGVALAAVAWLIDKPWVAQKFRPSTEREAQTRRRIIQREASSPDRCEWAGEYYLGDGMGVNFALSLAPQSGFVLESHGCVGSLGVR